MRILRQITLLWTWLLLCFAPLVVLCCALCSCCCAWHMGQEPFLTFPKEAMRTSGDEKARLIISQAGLVFCVGSTGFCSASRTLWMSGSDSTAPDTGGL